MKRIRLRRRMQQTMLEVGTLCHLSDLSVGQSGRVLALHNDNLLRRKRLLDMGITSGVIVTIKRIAPLGDPVGVMLRGYELLLRKEDMKNIDIEVVAS